MNATSLLTNRITVTKTKPCSDLHSSRASTVLCIHGITKQGYSNKLCTKQDKVGICNNNVKCMRAQM